MIHATLRALVALRSGGFEAVALEDVDNVARMTRACDGTDGSFGDLITESVTGPGIPAAPVVTCPKCAEQVRAAVAEAPTPTPCR